MFVNNFMQKNTHVFIGSFFFVIGSLFAGVALLVWIQSPESFTNDGLPGYIAFIAMGSLFALIGGFIVFRQVRKNRIQHELLQAGSAITAQITEVIKDTTVTVNGRSPFAITAQYHDPSTDVIYMFKSNAVWFDPSAFLSETITVFVDPSDYKRYYVDIRFLPKRA